MKDSTKKAIWFFVTGASAFFSGAWALIGQPTWWPTVLSLVAAIVAIIVGKPWSPPQEPQ